MSKTKKKWKFWSRSSSKVMTTEEKENIPKPKIILHTSKIDKELIKMKNYVGTLPSDIYISPKDENELNVSSLTIEETGLKQTPERKKMQFHRPELLLPPPPATDDATNPISLLLNPNNDRSSVRSLTSSKMKRIKGKATTKGSYLTSTRMFQNLVTWAFREVDQDQSGHISKEELYTGMLLIHLKLATYLGPAATQPMSRNRVNHIFTTLDTDQSGSLDIEEFGYVMTILCSQIVSRIGITLVLSLVFIPFGSLWILGFVRPYVFGIMEYSMGRVYPYYRDYRPYYDTFLYHSCTPVDFTNYIPSQYEEYTSFIAPYLPTTYFSCTILLLSTYSILKCSIPLTTFLFLIYTLCTYHKEYIVPNMQYVDTLPDMILRSVLVTVFVPSAMIYIDTFFRILTDLTKKRVKHTHK